MKKYEFKLNNGKKLVCETNRSAHFDLGDLSTFEHEHPDAESGKKYVLRDIYGRRVGYWYLSA